MKLVAAESGVKLAAAVLGALLCGGCTARYVSGEAIASNKAVEAETNSILVTNILRARDGRRPSGQLSRGPKPRVTGSCAARRRAGARWRR